MLDQRLLVLIGSFSDPGYRTRAAKKLAEALGAEDLMIFSKDPVLDVLIPSPGFPQTLPEGISWKNFINACSGQQHFSTDLVSPFTKKKIRTHGLEAADGSILVLLGEKPNILMSIEVVALVPLIVSALATEKISIIAKGEVEIESLYAERAKVLANALDSTRRTLESELRKSASILNSITDAFFALDTDWKFIEMNSQAEDLLQKKRESLLGNNIWDIFPEARDSNFNQQYELAMSSQEAVFFEEYFPALDAWYEVRAYPSRDALAVYFNNINERKKAAEELLHQKKTLEQTYVELQSERSRLEAILRQMPEGVMIADPSGKLVLWNTQMDVMMGGFKPTNFIEEYDQYKGFKPDGSAYLHHEWPLARSLLKGEIIQSEEVRFQKFDGSLAYISISSAPIVDEAGQILAGVAIHHDITRAKQLEEELRYQSYLTQTITDNAASALFMMDKEGRPTYMNPAAKKLTGYNSLDEISGQPLHYAVHWKKPDGSHYPMEECPIDNAQAELRKVQDQEEIFCSKDGRLFPVSFSVSPLEKNGEVVGSVLEFRDISNQKDFEGKLQKAISDRDKSLETLETINKVGQRLTAELDLDKLVQQVTDDGTRLTEAQYGAFFYNSVDENGNALLLSVVSGVAKEEFLKFPNPRATAVFHPTFIGAGTVRSADITKDPRFGKIAPNKGLPPGRLPVRSYLAVSVISRTGEVIGGIFFGHEKENVFTEQAERIAEGLAAQAAVAMDNARLYRKVQESVSARDEFLSIASHELKTPLTSLKLQTQLRSKRLLMGQVSYFDKDVLSKMFEIDARQIDRLSRLIDDMLDISRVSTGKLTLQPESFDLCSLVKEVLERYLNQIQDYGSQINLDCASEVRGTWDKFRIEQVVTNLLTNALRYGNQKPIDISVMSKNDEAIIVFQDHGLGIAKENQKRIFERFERAISANEISGLGLGLYIVKQILKMHNGTIDVESELGKGARFTISLPFKEGQSHE